MLSAIVLLTICGCTSMKQEAIQDEWKAEVEDVLKVYDHRNWIVVADAAYPQQSNQTIKTITIEAGQLEAVGFVNNLIKK